MTDGAVIRMVQESLYYPSASGMPWFEQEKPPSPSRKQAKI
jgi:hypothetical protein